MDSVTGDRSSLKKMGHRGKCPWIWGQKSPYLHLHVAKVCIVVLWYHHGLTRTCADLHTACVWCLHRMNTYSLDTVEVHIHGCFPLWVFYWLASRTYKSNCPCILAVTPWPAEHMPRLLVPMLTDNDVRTIWQLVTWTFFPHCLIYTFHPGCLSRWLRAVCRSSLSLQAERKPAVRLLSWLHSPYLTRQCRTVWLSALFISFWNCTVNKIDFYT